MNITMTLREFNIGKFQVVIDCIDYCEPTPWLNDLFETVERHQGGVTIRNPVSRGDDRCYQWYMPTQYTLSELASEYARQGRDNPSSAAYQSAQDELGWYLTASDFGFQVTVKKNGVTLTITNAGFGFDYSHQYSTTSLEQHCNDNYSDVIFECVQSAITESRETLAGLTA